MRKIINKNLIILIISIVVTTLLLIILSNNVVADTVWQSDMNEIKLSYQLGRYILNYSNDFMNATANDIFEKLNRKLSKNWGIYVLNDSDLNSIDEATDDGYVDPEMVDLYYNSVLCLFHHESSTVDDGYNMPITNIIDIETPGTMKIYKYKGVKIDSDGDGETDSLDLSGNKTVTLDSTTAAGTKAIYDAMVANGSISSDRTYYHTDIQKDIAAFAYLVTQSSKDGKTPAAENKYSQAKKAIEWAWKYGGSNIAIRKYVNASGILDDYYYNAEGQNNQLLTTTETIQTQLTEAYTAAGNLINLPTLVKNTSSETPTIKYLNNKAYIGPLKVTYSGGTPTLTLKNKEKNTTIPYEGWVEKSGSTFGTLQTGTICSEKEFYIVAAASDVTNITTIKVEIAVEYEQYKARILLANNKTAGGQNLMFYYGYSTTGTLDPILWEIEQSREVKIQKQDANGNALNVEGIKFAIYEGNNTTAIGTLETGSNGQTDAIKLNANKTYTLKEISNGQYGYKGGVISGATISSGGTISNISNNSLQFSVTADSTIYIKNTPILGNITVEKKDEEGNKLEGVKFVLYKPVSSTTGYIQLYNGSTFIEEIDEEIDITDYTVKYVAYNGDINSATKFVTNSDGNIIIKNLEVYSGVNTLYNYSLREVETPNYGYQGMTSTVVLGDGTEINVETDGDITFNLSTGSANTIVTATNIRELGDIEIEKISDPEGKALEDVSFKIEIGTGKYLQLYDVNGLVQTPLKGEVIINENNIAEGSQYSVEYVTSIDDATEFRTNSAGKIIIKNVEVYETRNQQYTYTAHEINNPNYSFNDGNSDTSFKLEVGKTTTVTIKNVGGVANIGLIKCDENDSEILLEGVEFKITGIRGYIALYDEEGNKQKSVKGTVTINEENVATTTEEGTEYRVEYVTDESDATTFITDSEGKIVINNVEVYKSSTETITYIAKETYNPNHGYGAGNNYTETQITSLAVNELTEVTITNTKNLTGISLPVDGEGNSSGKHDTAYESIKLENVEFVLKAYNDSNSAYIKLVDEEGNFVQRVKGDIIINGNNTAQTAGEEKEYKLEYYKTTKSYKELTDEEKENVTIFLTGVQGELSIQNIEEYDRETGKEYKYSLIEIYNPYYGYDSNFVQDNIEVESGKTTEVTATNTQEYINLSGYVWIENTEGKSNEYDCVYTNTSSDIILTDLYLTDENGKVTGINPNAKIPVQIILREISTGKIIKSQPDEYNTVEEMKYDENGKYVEEVKYEENGKYKFNDITTSEEAEKLQNYEVVFIYDGFYYTTIVENLEEDNGSKVKENATQRAELNNKFAIIQEDSKVIANDGTVNTVTYTKEGNVSTVDTLNFDTTISASTSDTQYYLWTQLDKIKKEATTPVNGVSNINMGLVLREQPKIELSSDLYEVIVGFEEAKYNYKWGSTKDFEDIGVNLEYRFPEDYRYSQTIYGSDIQAANDQNKALNVYIIYKVDATNASNTLTVLPRQIINYYDSRYELVDVGLGLDSTYTITNSLNYAIQEGNAQGNDSYKAVIIDFNQQIETGSANTKSFYITFKLSTASENEANRNAIYDLLNAKSTFHNASEILSYTSYYGKNTSMMEGTQYISDTTKAGNLYAGIDRESQPGNMELKLTDYINKDGNKDGTQVLDISDYEPDSTSAPSLLLEVGEKIEGVRRISGNVWEDLDDNTEDTERLGNGYIDSNEKFIANVTVTLLEVNSDGSIGNVAKYSDGVTEATTTTDENGLYTLGYYDEATNKYNGILPGKKYVVQYTYGNQSYIVGENRYLNVNDYKSTIITSDVIKTAIEESSDKITYNGVEYPTERWNIIEENNRYSDAVDKFETRQSLDEEIVNYSTYEDTILAETDIDAYSPVMYIPIEFTPDDSEEMLDISGESIAQVKQFISNLENVDFGIIERARVNITIDKEITSLEISTQIGADIIPEGNPSDPNSEMQHVKVGLDGTVPVEVESDLLQGARLYLEYTITLKNDCELDYTEEEYYVYGTGGTTERTLKISKVVDYLDGTMEIDAEASGVGTVWEEISISDLTTAGLISPETINGLNQGDYTILETEEFNELNVGEEKSINLYTKKVLASSDEIRENNHVEIIELIGGRTIKNSIPGDYNPATGQPDQQDDDKVQLIITPPTGTTINYMPYMIAVPVTLVIVILGIVIIKKKVLK